MTVILAHGGMGGIWTAFAFITPALFMAMLVYFMRKIDTRSRSEDAETLARLRARIEKIES